MRQLNMLHLGSLLLAAGLVIHCGGGDDPPAETPGTAGAAGAGGGAGAAGAGGGAGDAGAGGSSGKGGASGAGAGGSSGKGGAGGSMAGAGGSMAGASGAGMGGAGMAGAGGSMAGAGGTSGGAAGTGGAAGATGGTAGTAGKGGGSTDNNDTFETATPIKLDTTVMATLIPVDKDVDFYTFTGKKGDRVVIATAAKPQNDPFAVEFPDLVMELFDAAKVKIAQDDDWSLSIPTNDARLATVLPADGVYYVKVQECNAWSQGGPMNCSPAAGITSNDYSLSISLRKGTEMGVGFEKEPNDATANPLTYIKTMGGYGLQEIWGGFSSATDVDVFSFTLPADTPNTMGSRAVGSFVWQLSGPGVGAAEGNGSTSSFGDIAIIDPADPTMAIARINVNAFTDLSPPLMTGKLYNLVAKRGMMTGSNDFYYLEHYINGRNPLEAETAGENNTLAGAEALVEAAPGRFFIEGDLTAAPADVDHFSVKIGAGLNSINVGCGAASHGSGLRKFKVDILASDGTAVAKGSSTETTAAISLRDVVIPAGATTLIVKMSATSQDPTVSSAFYFCGVNVVKK